MTDLIKRETLFAAALLALIVGVVVLFYRIVVPFFTPIAWAAILVMAVHPAHTWLSTKVRSRGLCALITTVGVAVFILLPSTYLAALMVGQAADLYERLKGGWATQAAADLAARLDPIIRSLAGRLDGIVDVSKINLHQTLLDLVGKISSFVVSRATSFLANVGRAALQFLVMLMTMYYLFKDGAALVGRVRESIPLAPAQAASMLAHVTGVVRATIYGGLVVAALQGLLGGLLFGILGLPSPVFWGAVMGILAMVPLLGAFIVYIPAAVVLFFSGATVKAIILLIVGVGVVSQIDNFLRPMLIAGQTELHPLLLFFAIAGGVSVFGFLGLVLGPVIAAVFVAIFDLYRMAIRTDAAPHL